MWNTKVKSIRDVKNEDIAHYIQNVETFTLIDQIRPVKIVQVTNGNLVDVLTVVSMYKATSKFCSDKVNVMIRQTCRIFGCSVVDVSDNGENGNAIISSFLKNKELQCYFRKKDDDGNYLVTIYANDDDLLNYMLNYNSNVYGKLFVRD